MDSIRRERSAFQMVELSVSDRCQEPAKKSAARQTIGTSRAVNVNARSFYFRLVFENNTTFAFRIDKGVWILNAMVFLLRCVMASICRIHLGPVFFQLLVQCAAADAQNLACVSFVAANAFQHRQNMPTF